jgi:hypothetical protein
VETLRGELQQQYRAAAEQDLVASTDGLGVSHSPAVDPGSVAGTEISQAPAVVVAPNLRVLARHGVVFEHDIAVLASADYQGTFPHEIERQTQALQGCDSRAALVTKAPLAEASDHTYRGQICREPCESICAPGSVHVLDAPLERIQAEIPLVEAPVQQRRRPFARPVGYPHAWMVHEGR